MATERQFLAIIPARGGSKRLPRKNVLDLAGKPLIAWTIQAGLQSKYIDRVIVSTEDEEIASVAAQNGADVPFMRPRQLAQDDTTTIDVIKYTLQELLNHGERYRYIVLLQPTSPLRCAKYVDEAIELLFERQADAVVSVSELEHPVEWSNTLPDDLSLDGFFPSQYREMRSQDFPKRYQFNGAIYISSVLRMFKENALIYDGKSYAYVMDRCVSIDIDTEMDFLLASIILEKKTHGNGLERSSGDGVALATL